MRALLECLVCGMAVPADFARCPKCDDDLALQTDGWVITRDIAHQRETVAQAMIKFSRLMSEAAETRAAAVRVIVGSGLIRDRIQEELVSLTHRGDILGFETEGRNHGALLVKLRG